MTPAPKKTAKKTATKKDTSSRPVFPTRGRTFVGTVVSDKMQRTVTVEWPRQTYIKKYERYASKKTRVKAHNPQGMDAKKGDSVVIQETRPLSKTKHFIIVEVRS